MSWATVFTARLRGLFARDRRERELEDEVRFHLDMQAEDNLKGGMDPSNARYAARRSFGAIEPMKETYRERRAFAVVETFAQDVRYALRTLWKSPGFTITSVLTLGLAIGATTAMLSIVNAVLLRPLPYTSPEQLAMLWTEIPTQNIREGRASYIEVEQWRRESKTFADMAVIDGLSVTLTTADDAEQISAARVSPNLFSLLGVQPLHGRLFSSEEAERREPLIVISHRFWRARYASSIDAIGSSLVIDGRPFRIIGILPEGDVTPLYDTALWQPHTLGPPNARICAVIGRRQDNASFLQAQEEMSAIARRLAEQSSVDDPTRGISVVPFGLQVVGSKSRLALWMMTGAVICVLLIASANVAGLSLARSVSRTREIAVRAALGASRGRITRQLLAESLTLALVSGLLGSWLAVAAIRAVRALGPSQLPRLNELTIDLQVLGWALAVSCFTGVVVGLMPAMTVSRPDLRTSVEDGGRSVSSGSGAQRVRRALIVGEFALAIMLLAGAGLLIRSWQQIERLDLGYKPERTLLVSVSAARIPVPQRTNFYARTLEEIAVLPGVQGTAVTSEFFIGGSAEQIIIVDGVSRRLRFRRDEVSQGFFRTVSTPLLKGRFFSSEDTADSTRVTIVNDAMARTLWPGSDPVGKALTIGSESFTVVGVVGNMRRQGIENEPIAQMFEAVTQNPPRLGILVVTTTAQDPLQMASGVKAAVHRTEKSAPVYGVTTLEKRLEGFLSQRRLQTSLLVGVAAAALLIAAIGIYGLIQYSIARRTHEIGIRMAIGARAGEIFSMVIGEGLKISLVGLTLGLIGALWLGRAGSSLLFGVSPADPLTFVAVSVLLIVVAIAACYFPARRAMKVEPVIALRQE
jgi:predicted permease